SRKCFEDEAHRTSPRINRQSGDSNKNGRYRGHTDPTTAKPTNSAGSEPTSPAECVRSFQLECPYDATRIGIRKSNVARIPSGEFTQDRNTRRPPGRRSDRHRRKGGLCSKRQCSFSFAR